ncbi:hypothetical protein A0U87_17210 [Sphingobium sp. MP9-4]|uniref:TlpA family protein disulfide reductase n=2 Tax=Sphingobium TaxID=165695 RepID=UPI00113E7227|nr:TlpA family protein disulfide reductase [Sphingobium sp. MP9-4]TKV42624.1 hypothetical protein A0U87_17210 [Sphingobium sp. MP9-4]
MIAIDRIVVVALLWAFLSAGAFIAARSQTRAGRAAWWAALTGIIAARVGYVAENADAFAVEPWTVLALWQGGFSLWPGVIAAAAVIIALLWRSRAMFALIAALAVLTTVQLTTSALLAPASRPMPGNVILAELDGRPVDLASLRGRPFVLNMWASWCPPCRREMPMLIEVAAQSDVPILLVNQGEDAAQVRAYLERERLSPASVRLDLEGTLSQATGSRAMPTTLFIDAEGRIQRTHAGEISRAALQAELRDLGRKTS